LRSVGAKCCRIFYPTDWKQFDVEDLFNPFALIDAVTSGDVDRVKELIEAGKHELNLEYEDGYTALDCTRIQNESECADNLHSVGAECGS
jgi:hypothetical protein